MATPEVQMCALKLWAWWTKLTVLSKLLSKYMHYTLNATIILDLCSNIHHVGLIFFTFFDILAEFPAFENDGLAIIQNSENSFKNIQYIKLKNTEAIWLSGLHLKWPFN